MDVTPNQQLRWSAEYPLARINDMAWSPNGELLAVAGMIHESENAMYRSPTRLYAKDGAVVAELFSGSLRASGKDGSVSDLEWSSDSNILATAEGLNMSASLFSPSIQKRVELNDVAISVHAVRWSPDGRFFVLITGDRDLYLYDAEGKQIDVVGPAGSTVDSVCWHPDGTKLACADPFGVMLWGLVSNAITDSSAKPFSLVPMVRISLPLGNDQWVNTLEWNRDGSRLAVGAFGTGDVWLIDQEGTPLATLRGHTESIWRTLFSSTGILATTSSDATTRLWDQDGKPLAVLVSATPEEDILISVAAWSPNGELLAVASPDHFIRIYTSDAVPLANLRGHVGNIQAVSWHPYDQLLASADDKDLTCLWKIPIQPE
jgi:WD40 repeat protein